MEGYDESKIQWEYSLESSDAYFNVHDWKLTTLSIEVYLKKDSKQDAEKVANEFLNQLIANSKKIKIKFANLVRSANEVVIQNPYIIYKESADSTMQLIETLINPETYRLKKLEISNVSKQFDLCRSAFILYLSSVEGFVNLIYELYLRKDLKEQRIIDRLNREQIDLKLRLAPVYCECFSSLVLDPNNSEIRKFFSLVDLRNDFVHANLTKPMISPIVYEDDFEFFVEVKSENKLGISKNISELNFENLIETRKTVEGLVEYIINCMSLRYKREFESIIDIDYFKVQHEDGQVFII